MSEINIDKLSQTLGVTSYSDLTKEELLQSKDLFENALIEIQKFDDNREDIIEIKDQLKEIKQLLI